MARILDGPWIEQALAGLGAEVVKLESPEGDDTRKLEAPFVERDGDVRAAFFYAANRGKRIAEFSQRRSRRVRALEILRSGVGVGAQRTGFGWHALPEAQPLCPQMTRGTFRNFACCAP